MKTILVKGPAFSRSGYGEQTRFALRALRAHENRFNILLQNIAWGHTGWINEQTEERQWLEHLLQKTQQHVQHRVPIDISLQVTIPNEWEKIAPINVGFTAGIETTKVAPHWIEKSRLMDRIITVSNHSKNVYNSTVYQGVVQETGQELTIKNETPIEVVNYAVKNLDQEKIDINLDYDFNFLSVAQMGPRKNIPNTIKWFLEEFHNDEVGLILKTNIANCSTVDFLNTQNSISSIVRANPNAKCKIYLLHGDLTLQQMNFLYAHPKIKAYVTHTHGEGFGIPIFEAAYHGLPVIAPGWSGQNDFLYAPIKSGKQKKAKLRPLFCKVEYTIERVAKEAVWEGVVQEDSGWCCPTEKSAKLTMREVYGNYNKFKGMANKLKKHLLENFTKEQQYSKFANIINAEEEAQQEDWLAEIADIVKEYE